MSINVRTVDDDRWNGLLDRAHSATPFHRAEALDTLATHADATLYRLVGFKGEEPIGLFPVFERGVGPVCTVYSPPPGLNVHYLGPVLLNFGKLKRRKRDRRHRQFIEGVVEWIEARISPRYWNVRTPLDYEDARPFKWNDFEVEPRYSYVVDIEATPDELMARFSSDLRRKLKRRYDVSYEVTDEGPREIDRIVEQTRKRHLEQGVPFPVTATFVHELAERLPSGTIRPYVCRVDGEIVGGLIDVETETCANAWIATGKTDAPIPVNDLLEWQVCLDARDRGRRTFDLMGANHERIYSYKAKFAPDLVPYISAKKWSSELKVATKLYQRLK